MTSTGAFASSQLLHLSTTFPNFKFLVHYSYGFDTKSCAKSQLYEEHLALPDPPEKNHPA